MKTKRKEKVKKEDKKNKRSEEKKVMPGIVSVTFDVPGRSLTTRPRGTHNLSRRNFIIKTFEPY